MPIGMTSSAEPNIQLGRNDGESQNLGVILGTTGAVALFCVAAVGLVTVILFLVVRKIRRGPPAPWANPANAPAFTVSNRSALQRAANLGYPIDIPIHEGHVNQMAVMHLQEIDAGGVDTAARNGGVGPDLNSERSSIDLEAAVDNGMAGARMDASPAYIANATASIHSYETIVHPSGVESVAAASIESSSGYDYPAVYHGRQVGHDREPNIPTTPNISYLGTRLM